MLPKFSLRETVLEGTCPETFACTMANPYRSFDGSCNNLAQPSWGQQNTIFQRLLPAHYGNGDYDVITFFLNWNPWLTNLN